MELWVLSPTGTIIHFVSRVPVLLIRRWCYLRAIEEQQGSFNPYVL